MKLRWLLVLAVLGAAVLAGCGSSDDGDGSSASTQSTSTTKAPTGTPIKVGVVGPTGTPAFNFAFDIASVRAGVRALNASGGLAGHPVEAVYCNDKGDPNQTAACARQMVDERVIGVFGGALLNGGTVLTPALEKAGIPQVGLTPISGPEYNSKNVYLFGTGGNGIYSVLAAYAAEHRIPTAIAQADNATVKPLVAALDAIMRQGGSAFTASVLVAPTQADFAPLVQAASRNDTRAVMPFLGAEQATQLIAASESAGMGFDWFSGYVFTKADADKIGGEATLDRMMTAQQFPPLTADNAVVKQFVADMDAEAAAGDADAEIGQPGGQSAQVSTGWLGIWALQQIVEEQGLRDVTAASFKAALDSTRDLDMGGVMPAWTPNAPGPRGLSRAANDTYFLIGWKDGEPTLLLDDPVNVADVYAGKTAAVDAFGDE